MSEQFPPGVPGTGDAHRMTGITTSGCIGFTPFWRNVILATTFGAFVETLQQARSRSDAPRRP